MQLIKCYLWIKRYDVYKHEGTEKFFNIEKIEKLSDYLIAISKAIYPKTSD